MVAANATTTLAPMTPPWVTLIVAPPRRLEGSPVVPRGRVELRPNRLNEGIDRGAVGLALRAVWSSLSRARRRPALGAEPLGCGSRGPFLVGDRLRGRGVASPIQAPARSPWILLSSGR
jgi:hypothetical protein